jgi:hypothetical protein
MKQPAHCKYTPLEEHLRQVSAHEASLTFTFERLEQAMQSKLPQSAFERASWWNNEVRSTLTHKNAWLHAGLKVAEVNLGEKWVRFVRAK